MENERPQDNDKDEKAQPGGASQVSAILRQMNSSDNSVFTAATQQVVKDRQKSSVNTLDLPEAYKAAIKTGFKAAILLILCIAIVSLMNNALYG